MTDIRHAFRTLRTSPGHSTLIVVCLSIGLSVSLVAFALATSLIYGELPGMRDRFNLTRLSLQHTSTVGSETVGGQRVSAGPLTMRDFETLAANVPTSVVSVGAEGRRSVVVRHAQWQGALRAAFVSPDYFTTLGTTPAQGRLLGVTDGTVDGPPAAVISHAWWQWRLGGGADVVGSVIEINRRAYTIVGIAPAQFSGLLVQDVGADPLAGTQLWLPLHTAPPMTTAWLDVVARKQPTVTTADVEGALGTVARAIEGANPATRKEATFVARSFGIDPAERPGVALAGVGLFMTLPLCVLGLAVANVLQLQMARSLEHADAISTRLALGATWWRALQWLTTEMALLTTAGLGLASILTDVLLRWSASLVPFPLRLSGTVVMAGVTLSLLAMVVATWLPARLVRTRLTPGRAVTATRSHLRLRRGLVVTQVSVSVAMVLIVALSMQSLRVMAADIPAALHDVSLTAVTFAEDEPVQARRGWMAGRTDAWSNDGLTGSAAQVWLPAAPSERQQVAGHMVSRQWLQTIGTRTVAGRTPQSPDEIQVSDSLARQLATTMAGALGQTVSLQLHTDSSPRPATIVGVVVPSTTTALRRSAPAVYLVTDEPAATVLTASTPQVPFNGQVRAGDPRVVVRPVGTVAAAMQAGMPDGVLVGSTFAVLGGLATLLALVGLTSALVYFVQLRGPEFAVRAALGATPRDLVALVGRQTTRMAGVGLVVGVGLGVALAQAMQHQLIGVAPWDPASVSMTAAAFVVCAAVAALGPSLRASRVSPATLLRR